VQLSYTYDAWKMTRLDVSYPDGTTETTRYNFDNEHRLVRIDYPNGTHETFSDFNAYDFARRSTNSLTGKTTTYQYSGSSSWIRGMNIPDFGQLTMGFNSIGQLKEFTSPTAAFDIAYDPKTLLPKTVQDNKSDITLMSQYSPHGVPEAIKQSGQTVVSGGMGLLSRSVPIPVSQ